MCSEYTLFVHLAFVLLEIGSHLISWNSLFDQAGFKFVVASVSQVLGLYT